MIRLFYTGATAYLKEQKSAYLSLGGYPSSSPFANAAFEALFSDISNLSIQQALPETKMLALKNEGAETLSNIRLYYVYPKNNSLQMFVSAIAPTKRQGDSGCEYFFEQIPNSRSAPIYSQEFFEANSQYASARVDFTLPAISGEVITLVGVSTTPAPTNLSLDDTYKLVEAAFKNNTTYQAVFTSDPIILVNQVGEESTTYDKYLLITKKQVGDYTAAVTFSTTGQVTLKNPSSFSGGFDNYINLGDLKPGEFLGIWFKKEIIQPDPSVPGECVDMSKVQNSDKVESIQMYFEW